MQKQKIISWLSFGLKLLPGKDVAEAYTLLYFIYKARAQKYPDTHYGMLSIQYLLQARYLGDPEAITIYDNFNKELLGNNNLPEPEENSLKDNEIAIVADGIYVQVRETYGDKEIILQKKFGEMEIVTFERYGPVDIAFTDGSRIRVLVGDGDPIQPNTNKREELLFLLMKVLKNGKKIRLTSLLQKKALRAIILHIKKMKKMKANIAILF